MTKADFVLETSRPPPANAVLVNYPDVTSSAMLLPRLHVGNVWLGEGVVTDSGTCTLLDAGEVSPDPPSHSRTVDTKGVTLDPGQQDMARGKATAVRSETVIRTGSEEGDTEQGTAEAEYRQPNEAAIIIRSEIPTETFEDLLDKFEIFKNVNQNQWKSR